MTQEDRDKFKSLLFNKKAITYDAFNNDNDPFVGIYFNELVEIIDRL